MSLIGVCYKSLTIYDSTYSGLLAVQGCSQTSKNEEAPSDRAPQARVKVPKAPRWERRSATIEAPKVREKFSIFSLKMAIFGAFWAAILTVKWTVLYVAHAD